MEWDKIFANGMSDKRLISKLHKEHRKLNSKNKKPNKLIKKWAEEDMQMSKYMKGAHYN